MHLDAFGCVRTHSEKFGNFDPKIRICNFHCVLEDLGLPPIVFRATRAQKICFQKIFRASRLTFGRIFPECVRTHPNASRCIRMHPNASKRIQTHPNKPENFEKHAKTSKNFAKSSKIFEKIARCTDGPRPVLRVSRQWKDFMEAKGR